MNKYKTAIEILKILEKNNAKAYIIGGYPRDKYLNIESNDIDICTSAKYKLLKSIFKNVEKNKYSSYKVEYNNYTFEITTFRKETKYIKNRFPQIKYTKSLKKDLKRRDFIMNTLCINSNEEYIDLKKAKKDIDNKIIRLIGTKKSFEKDALRILRAIRFATVLDFKLDKKLEKAIVKYRHLLKNISSERKKQELTKIFEHKNINYGIELIKKFKLDTYMNVNIDNVKPTNNINAIWAQILIDDTYNFSKQDKKQIDIFKKLLSKKLDQYDIYKYGKEITKVVNEINKEKLNIDKLYDELVIKDRSEIDINFFDREETELTKYTNINEIYKDIEQEIINKKLKNKKTSIKKYIQKNYKHTL